MRSWISQEGLARFDAWLQRYGRVTIFVARFLPGVRVPAFFTAGSMNTSVVRFYVMDGLGVLISAPLFVWLGWYFGEDITTLVEWVRKAEQTVLWAIGIAVVLAIIVYWVWHRRRTKKLLGEPVAETTVGPSSETKVLVDVESPPLPADPGTAEPDADGETEVEQDRDRASHPEEAGDERGDDPDSTPAPAADERGGETPR